MSLMFSQAAKLANTERLHLCGNQNFYNKQVDCKKYGTNKRNKQKF